MERFFIDPKDIDINEKIAKLSDKEDLKHLTKVLRAKIGEKFEICNGQNCEYEAKLIQIEKDFAEFKILEEKLQNRETNFKVYVYQGYPKGQKMELIIQKLTEIGVFEIIPVIMKRSVVQLKEDKEEKKIQRFQKIIDEAAKQCKRGVIPKIKPVMSFKEAVDDASSKDLILVPYELENQKNLKNILNNNKSINSIAIFIGPEGGFEETEIKELIKNKANTITLGNRILRTETAAIIASAIVVYELEN